MEKPQHVKPNLYTYMMEALKEIAKEYGYNLLVHGSLNRDLDLIAVPWVDAPKPEIELIRALDLYLTGKTRTSASGNDADAYMFSVLEGGRNSYVIEMARHGEWNNYEKDMQYYLDISVTPLGNSKTGARQLIIPDVVNSVCPVCKTPRPDHYQGEGSCESCAH